MYISNRLVTDPDQNSISTSAVTLRVGHAKALGSILPNHNFYLIKYVPDKWVTHDI